MKRSQTIMAGSSMLSGMLTCGEAQVGDRGNRSSHKRVVTSLKLSGTAMANGGKTFPHCDDVKRPPLVSVCEWSPVSFVSVLISAACPAF